MRKWDWKRWLLFGGFALLTVVVIGGVWQAVRAWFAWNDIERVEFSTEEARQRLPELPAVDDTEPPEDVDWDTVYQGILVIGTDEPVEAATYDKDRIFADAVILYLAPENGTQPVLVSFPRDLVVINPCTGEEIKLDQTLEGCGSEISGPELVALTIEDFTGVTVDHFGLFGFEGFVQVVDALGGVELCVDRAIRQAPNQMLAAGCSVADGSTALWFVRSRTLQEQIDGEWRFIEETSDLERTARHQDLLFAVLDELRGMQNPRDLASVAEQFDDLIVLSDSLTIPTAIDMAWELRGTPQAEIRRVTIPTESEITKDGEFVRRATVDFSDLLSEAAS